MITVSVVVAAAVWLTFIVWYSVRARWWKTPYGRNTFWVSTVLFWVLARIAAVRLIPDFPEHEILGALVYILAAVVGVWRTVLMEGAQRESGRLDAPKRKD